MYQSRQRGRQIHMDLTMTPGALKSERRVIKGPVEQVGAPRRGGRCPG